MFKKWNVYYYYKLVGTVTALTEHDAFNKGHKLVSEVTGIARSASAYTGLGRNNIEVKLV